jgi:hypothetical protein
MTTQRQKIKEVIINNSAGFTIDFNGEIVRLSEGYFIGLTNIKGKDINRLIDKVLIIKKFGFKETENIFIGGWKDPQTNLFYLDLSVHSNNLTFSRELALRFKQKAIFDILNQDSINP